MKTKRFVLILTVCFLFAGSLWAQTEEGGTKIDKVKKGWNFGGLPVVSFDSDLGFQYGALLNIFNYGDGSRYPDFNHNLYLEWSRFTKGSGINRIFFDTKTLIPGIRFTTDLSYLTDKTYDFYGFNGYESQYNSSWTDDGQSDYMSRVFYKYDRKLFRFSVDLQGKLPVNNLGWAAGVGIYDFTIGRVDIDKLNEGKTDNLLPDTLTLYEYFEKWGIIKPEEKDGGLTTYLKAGVVYDTRDNEPNPNKGIWTEAVVTFAPSFLGIGKEYQHMKFSLTHRQYFTLYPERLSLAYRLGYQTTVFGSCPFYLQPNITTLILRGATSEGLGGSKSLRGIIRNRVIGDGIAYGNLELRWKFVYFTFINQNFYLSLNGFLDGGRVVKPVQFGDYFVDPEDVGIGITEEQIFSTDKESFHLSYGGGFGIVMNRNFIIAIDHGRPFDKRDGKSGTYIGLNFLF